MMEIELKKIHAFSEGSSFGNPAGYVFDKYNLTEEQMQQLAFEMTGIVSEVVYLKKGRDNIDYSLRYFSCEREVAFCGHGTLAVIDYEVKSNNEVSKKKSILIETSKGVLEIENDFSAQTVYITAPKAEYIHSEIDLSKLSHALKIKDSYLDKSQPVEIINAGLNTLLVPFVSPESVIECDPDYSVIREFCFQNNCDIVNIFSPSVNSHDNTYRTRIFAPTFGYLEDPATGSGNSALGYYLIKYNLWESSILHIEQGLSLNNPNKVYLKKAAGKENSVKFGGKSVVKFEGKYYL